MTRPKKAKTHRFLITKIDPDLWRKFKTACAHYSISSRQAFLNHITNVVNAYEHRDSVVISPILDITKEPKKK